ncbi:DUF4328 domain-containing protein [Streptomyces sp. NPDC004539]|uniref:DUF4328 domain-containing protein n=1 Tax=Streptomyces sp. NPDC004539 TaxID=3154280 RepID=UPI0033BE7913
MSVAWLRSPVALGRATAVLLGVSVAAQLFALAADFVLYGIYDDAVGGASGADFDRRVDDSDRLSLVSSSVQIVSLLATAVVYLCWFWRVRVNAEVFAPDGHAMKRGWVIGGWLVPFANLWFPRRVMADVWRASVPAGRGVSAAPVNLWWAACVLWFLSDRVVSVRDRSVETLSDHRGLAGAFMAMDAVGAVAGVLAIVVVVRLTRMQDEKAHVGAVQGALIPPVQG